MSEQQNDSPRQAAVNALISWAKTGWGYYSMKNTVSYLYYSTLAFVTYC